MKIEYIDYILSVLNGFNNNIEFTFEEKNDVVLPFLSVLICRNDNSIETTVYRKSTNDEIYLNWNAFALDTWKRKTLKILVEHAYIVYSTEDFLDKELKYLEKIFHENNNYQKYVIKQILKQSRDECNKQELGMTDTNLNLNDVVKKEMSMKKSNVFLLYHMKIKKEILSLNP